MVYTIVGFLLGLIVGFILLITLAYNMQESGKFFVKEGKSYKPFKSPFAGE